MKKSNIIFTIFLLLVLSVAGVYIFKNLRQCVPEGMVLVEQSTVDSLKAYILLADSLKTLANLPPDTISVIDTVYLDTTKTITTTPLPSQTSDTLITHYTDSLCNDEINVSIGFDVAGHLTSKIIWEYKAVIKEKTVTIEKKIPYPVIQNVEIPVRITGNYLSLVVGGNDKMFNFGVDYDLVKEKNIYGLQYRRQGDINVYGVKLGINLNTLFKK